MGCGASFQDDGSKTRGHEGPKRTIRSPTTRNHTYDSANNGYRSPASPTPYDSSRHREPPNQSMWYPNQPPGIASYYHGVATVNFPIAPRVIKTGNAGAKSKTTSKINGQQVSKEPVSKTLGLTASTGQPPHRTSSPPQERGKPSLTDIKDEAEVWRSEEMKSEKPEPEEELGEPHPDHELILGVTEDYVAFKKRLESSLDGSLYEDPDFPADDSSLFLDAGRNKHIVWRRPSEICSEPRMFVDGTSREDVIQGSLSDCWFLAACAGIAQHKDLVRKIIPENQTLVALGYVGAVHFKFWRFGRWVDVVIDDRLPTRNDKLVFASSSEKTEFWPALMEKAYAKLNGTYQGLSGGMAADAFVDLTGGLSEVFLFSQESVSADFYALLYKGARSHTFMACSKKNPNFMNVTADESGIVPGHSYTITDVQAVFVNKRNQKKKKKKNKISKEITRLLRVRNPWGNSTEWKGDWSDNSSMWKKLGKEERERLNPKREDDGEFWMSFEDFCKKFNSVNTCTLGPDFDGDGKADVNESDGGFHIMDMRGHWIKDVSAGGCANFDSFYTNPQFSLTLLQPDDIHSTDSDEKRGMCSIIIAVLQEYRRSKKNLAPKKQQIGFRIYETDDPEHPQSRHRLKNSSEVGRSGSFINYRQVYRRFTLAPGSYIILPSTFNPNISGSFMVRVFTEKRAVCKALGSSLEEQ